MPIISYTITREVSEEFLASIPDRAEYAFTVMIDPYMAEDLSDPESDKIFMTISDEPEVIYDFDKLRKIYDPADEDSDI
jgi:hypothetical protein